jgi:DHA2 family multidrug resistance protein-like MFS transporter
VGILPIGSIVIGVIVGVAWVRRQLGSSDPMIDLRLFRIPAFSASLVVNFLTIFVAVGYFLFVAQYLQLVLGLSPLAAGLCSVPSAIGFIVGSNAAPVLVRRLRPAYVMSGALVLAAIGLVALWQVGPSNGPLLAIVASVVIALGLAPVLTLTTDLVVGTAPPERAGAASGISETAVELGGALGISVLGSIGVAIYRGDLAHLPPALPLEAMVAARDTLGGAVKVAASLPASIGSVVLDVSRGAFIEAMHVAAIISAVVAVAVASFAAVSLRHVPSPAQEPEPEPAPTPDSDCFGRRRGSVGQALPEA